MPIPPEVAADPIDRAEVARMIYILADRVACGCATVSIEERTGGGLPNAIAIRGTAQDCLKTDHARDWPAMGARR